jgi:hypothetical protein
VLAAVQSWCDLRNGKWLWMGVKDGTLVAQLAWNDFSGEVVACWLLLRASAQALHCCRAGRGLIDLASSVLHSWQSCWALRGCSGASTQPLDLASHLHVWRLQATSKLLHVCIAW